MDRVEQAMRSLAEVDTYFVNDDEEDPKLYCNGGWNKAMEYFLDGSWDYLLLSSDDVVLNEGWSKELSDQPKKIWLPRYVESLEVLQKIPTFEEELPGKPGGACTLYPRAAIEFVYPIPQQLKVWFGDEYIYTKLRKKGYKVMQGNYCAFHYGSQSLDNPHIQQVIAADKKAWAKLHV